MSPPAQPRIGHAARAVISAERRIQIWDQFYISFKETIPHYTWCTREELVKAACSGKTGVKFTVDELTEVIRGRKHKREAGVDSQKFEGEWLYRFVPPGGKSKASKMPPPTSPPGNGKRSAPSSAAKAKPKPKPKTTPKRNVPLRPRAKSPAQTPTKSSPPASPPSSSASRKRGTPSAAAEDPMVTTRLRSATKRPRSSPRPRGSEQIKAEQQENGGGGSDAGTPGSMFRLVENGEEGRWSCAVM